jgi:DNA-binding response OmpR family regulator
MYFFHFPLIGFLKNFMNIFIFEDNQELAIEVKQRLLGFSHVYKTSNTCSVALEEINSTDFDLLL